MMYSFTIDEKSLNRGTKNDFRKGQSATVHTPLNQSRDKKKWRNDIYKFLRSAPSEDIQTLPELLIDRCLKKTTSDAETRLKSLHVFSKFSVDGVPFNSAASFAMYVKEEISETITKRDGTIGTNTHNGREKLHYPVSLFYKSDGYTIDNKSVLDEILHFNGGFAYVVNGFDYNNTTGMLNFRTTMIGPIGVPLSNIFKRQKGVGVKRITEGLFSITANIVNSEKEVLTEEESNSFFATLEKVEESRRNNGRLGEEFVLKNFHSIIGCKNTVKPVHVSKDYPQSPYDIEYIINGVKRYIEVKSTSGDKKTFLMSKGERRFMDKYDGNYILVLVTNVRSEHCQSFKYRRKDIMNEKKVKQELQGVRFTIIK